MRTVLVTGATGAIGSELTRYLVAEERTHVRLLIRARSREHLDQRLRGLFQFWGLDPEDAAVSARVEAFAGDVTQPRLGLDETSWDRLTGEVTNVIHSAGNVKLNRPLSEARQSAVDSLRHVVSFVECCRERGTFQKLEYVSTVGVGGRMPGPVPERALFEPRSFRNSYEAAKAESEVFLVEQMERGLSATIHRPGMVVGDSVTGKIIQFQVFYHLCEFLSGRRTFGVIPDARAYRLDIIPVDYVARAIQISSLRGDTSGRIFHLCTGPEESPTIGDIAKHVQERFAANGRPTSTLRPIPPWLMRTLLPAAGWFVGRGTQRALRAVPYFLDYLDGQQGFANTNSRAFFSSAGIELPAPERYLDTVLSYYLESSAAAPAA